MRQKRLKVNLCNLKCFLLTRMNSTYRIACDYMGEKLAWWLGITQPKFLYEIEEYKRMQEEEAAAAARNDDDQAEEIVIGADGQVVTPRHIAVQDADIEQRLYNVHDQVNFNKKPMGEHTLFQQSK